MSNYLAREFSVRREIIQDLQSLGYQYHGTLGNHPINTVMTGHGRNIHICLVDDVRQLANKSLAEFGANDVIITDNVFCRPMSCPVIAMPKSWPGIFFYRPQITHEPDRRFVFSVNRITPERMHIFLDTVQHWKHPCRVAGEDIPQGYMSFRCVPKNVNLPESFPEEESRRLWHKSWDELAFDKSYIEPFYQRFSENGDYRFVNHDLKFDEAMQRGMLNMTVESYCFDHVITFSEKTMRALAMPRPWVAFGSQFMIAQLRVMGFDVLDDLVDHSYDEIEFGERKMRTYSYAAVKAAEDLEWSDIRDRCHEAAQHNQQILQAWSHTWQADYAAWRSSLRDQLRV